MLEVEYGWCGICVEPNDALYAQLVSNRRCICLNCCLYDRDGEVEFLEAAEVYGGIVTHYDPNHFEFVRRFLAEKTASASAHTSAIAVAPVVKPARTIQSVLREYGAPPVIDYWSLDTEGSELAILRTFPFNEYRVRFLTVEHNHAPARADIAAFLADHGFERIAELGIDDGYAWVGHRPQAAWRSLAWNRGRTPRSAVSS